jgi:hypothetical protein
MDSQNWAACTEQPEQVRQNRSSRQDRQTGKVELNRRNRTGRTRLQDRTAKKGLPRQDSLDKAARTGPLREDSPGRIERRI